VYVSLLAGISPVFAPHLSSMHPYVRFLYVQTVYLDVYFLSASRAALTNVHILIIWMGTRMNPRLCRWARFAIEVDLVRKAHYRVQRL